MNGAAPHRPLQQLCARDQVEILLAEYNALYGLVTFRMTSLDRRAPIAGATLAASLASITVLPAAAQPLLFAGLPIALVWFLRTTVNHARSFEDVLTRLAEIETRLNRAAGTELVSFQTRHPSRGRAVGGRTGTETVVAVFVTCVTLLAATTYLYHSQTPQPEFPDAYDAFPLAVGCLLLREILVLRSYRYLKGLRLTSSSSGSDQGRRSFGRTPRAAANRATLTTPTFRSPRSTPPT